MLFNSYSFILIFLPATLVGYYLLRKSVNVRAANALLVLASLVFYSWWDSRYTLLLLGSILVNYTIGLNLHRKQHWNHRRKLLLVSGIAINLAALGYFKYTNFFIDNLNLALGTGFNLEHIVLPLAISFFTFQQIAFLMDTYRGDCEEYDFLNYSLFVTFFPQLIAGPIVHHKEMMPQLQQKKKSVLAENLAIGFSIFSIGLFKKVIIADSMAEFATPVFQAADAGQHVSFLEAWFGAISYSLQLYFDFSGYADMAIGAARMFGIRLPLNFNSPYKAVNIVDFWRRWHMTLSRFLRDYLYIGLGGNRQGKAKQIRNLMLTMLLGGLWHGAGWNFLIWGGLHGALLVLNHSWLSLRKNLLGHDTSRSTFGGRVISRVITFVAVTFCWVFFRAETFAGAQRICASMLDPSNLKLPPKYQERWGEMADWLVAKGAEFQPMGLLSSLSDLYTVLALVLLAMWLPNSQELISRYNPAYQPVATYKRALTLNRLTGVCVGLLFIASLLNMNKISEFIYFQF